MQCLIYSISVFYFLSATILLCEEVIFQDNFASLNNWKHVTFDKVPVPSRYEVVSDSNDGMMLKLESEKEASALISKKIFSIDKAHVLDWSWKVNKFPPLSDLRIKNGDDYPIRIYLIFLFDSDNASFLKKIKYKTFKSMYGEYPPDSSLNYVWTAVNIGKRSFFSPYSDQSRIIILQSNQNKGIWKKEKVDIISDYNQQFGELPPKKFQLGIMTDSDNTGGDTLAYLDYIRVLRKHDNNEQ